MHNTKFNLLQPGMALVALAASFSGPAFGPQQSVLSKGSALSRIAADSQRKYGVPGLAIGVVRDGKDTEVAAAGVRQVGKPDKIQTGDRFHLGSCTKLITSLMIYRLIDQHKLRLNTTLGQALKGTPMLDAYRSVTVGELLEFKGGIAPYLLIDPSKTPEVFDDKGTAEQQRARFVAHVLSESPVVKPGTKMVYSNASYAVLAYVASQRTGKNWEELVAENVFRPLAMTHSGFGRPMTFQTPNEPSGHVHLGNGWRPESAGYVHPASLSAAGDINASIADFGKFAAEELRISRGNSRLLSKSTAKLLRGNSPLQEGRTILGGAGAFTAGITLWPSHNLAVVIATNCGGGEELCKSVSTGLESVFIGHKPFAEAPASHKDYGLMLGLAPGGTVMVGGVQPGSIAEQAGLKEGDLIIGMNGKPINDIPDEQRFAALRGSPLILKVKRADRVLEIRMSLPKP